MEKKVTKKFYWLSALNFLTIGILSYPHFRDSLILGFVLVILVLNHSLLVRMVNEIGLSLSGQVQENNAALKRLFGWITLKMTLLAIAVAIVYVLNKNLIASALILMIFQLIIQVVSIKNNY